MTYYYLYLRNLMNEVATNEEGQDMIEYALVVALLVVAAIAGLGLLGGNINAKWTQISGLLTTP